MKILTVLDSYPPDLNGGAYFTHRLAKELMRIGHDVLVICPSLSLRTLCDNYEGVALRRIRSWPAVIYPNMRICWPLFTFPAVEAAVDRFQPDVIHLQGRFFLGDQVSRLGTAKGIPMLATNHFMPENFFHHSRLPEAMQPAFSRWAWRWVRKMFLKADAYSTPTRTAAVLLERLRLPHPVHAISCGVDTDVFKPRPPDRELRSRLGLADRKTVLYAGRLDREKNLLSVLQVVATAAQSIDCQLVLTGQGPERHRLKSEAARLGIDDRVVFSGRLSDDDYPRVFSVADCFIHAGTAELQSIATLEALASALPVVAVRAMALPELVADGENGFLFDVGDHESAAASVVKILTDKELNAGMRQASHNLAQEHTIMRTAAKYEQLYISLVA